MKLIFALAISVLLIAGSKVWGPSSFERKRALIAPPPHMEYFSFGFHEVVADSLWIRAIQDFDYCENEVAKNICRGNSWLYHMLDTVTTLSPHFRMPFATGGVALSVIITDVEGASKIFDKAVMAFPKDWPILYRAAYHALLEEKDKEKAARLLVMSAQAGGGEWFYSLAQRLYLDEGQRELAMRLYEDLRAQGFDDSLLERMKSRF